MNSGRRLGALLIASTWPIAPLCSGHAADSLVGPAVAAAKPQTVPYCRHPLKTQIILDFPRTLDPMTAHHRGCVVVAVVAAAAGIEDRLDEKVLVDEEYYQVTLQDLESRLLELMVADVDVEPAVKSAVALSGGSEP